LAAQNSVVVHIARPYATALYDLALEQGQVDAVEGDLAALSGIISESADFTRFLRSPVIPGDDKAVAMDAILAKAGVTVTVANFIRVVAHNGRLFILPAVIAAFRELAAKARGEVAAEVTSASPLSREQVTSLAATLKQKIGKTVTLQEHIDASLIGGLIVKVGSQMIDSSLKTKLTAMKIAMKEVG
jgi:F-type H+-transporting ATPase subunit delta